MTTTENVRAHLAPEAGEGAAAYVDPTDIGDAILEVYDDHEPRIVALETSGNVGTADLADLAVTTAKIADSAVTSAKIADGTIVDADINAAAGIAKTKITGTALVESTATTKGDLLARGTSAVERLAVGAVGTNPILIPDTSASAGVKWGTWTEADVAQASKVGNLLTLNQATLETSTTGWSGYHVTLTRDTGTYYQGAASLKVASSTSYVDTKAANTSSTIPVTAGRVYTAQAQIKTDGVTYARVGVLFYSGGSPSGSVTYGNTVTATTWTASTVTATAPANADAVYVYVFLDPAAASGTYAYADALGLWAGAGGMWAPPGYPINGIGQYTDNTAGKATYLWDETVPGWRLAVYDSGWRNVSAALEAGASGSLLIRRTATNVHVLSFNVTSSSDTIYIAPAGFAPGSGTEGITAPVVKFDGTVGAMTFNSPAGGHMALSAGIKAYAGAWLSAVFPVRTAIPTSLPGTQATAPV